MTNKTEYLVIRHAYCDAKKKCPRGHVGYLVDFLKKKNGRVHEIIHPFHYGEYYNSFLILHSPSESKILREFPNPKMPEVFLYIKDFVATFYLTLIIRKKFDVIIGADPLNAIAAVLLKKLGKADKSVYYVIDYTTKRFDNRLLNFFYQYICKKSAMSSDCIWNLSGKMAEVWSKEGIPETRNFIVPGGTNPHIPKKRIFQTEGKRLVFFGHLVEIKGIDLIIKALPYILKQVPDCKLIIVGTGDAEDEIKKLVYELKIDESVEFRGFIPEYNNALDVLSQCTIGLAPYLPTKNTIYNYAEPLKIKEYLACGLPIIMTGVPEIAKEIETQGAGIVINYDEQEFINAVLKLLTNEERYEKYKSNVIRLANKYEWDNIFEGALEKTNAV